MSRTVFLFGLLGSCLAMIALHETGWAIFFAVVLTLVLGSGE